MGSKNTHEIHESGADAIRDWLPEIGYKFENEVYRVGIFATKLDSNKKILVRVKSRNRDPGKEKLSINVFDSIEERDKFIEKCSKYDYDELWIGIHVKWPTKTFMYLTSLSHYEKEYYNQKGTYVWKMEHEDRRDYQNDSEVMCKFT